MRILTYSWVSGKVIDEEDLKEGVNAKHYLYMGIATKLFHHFLIEAKIF